MKKRVSLSTTLALIFISIALSVSLTMVFAMKTFSSTVNEVSKRQAMYDYLTEVDKSVRQNYKGSIDEVILQEDLATAYMKAIGDAYADYLTADEYADHLREVSGSKDGYGIELAQVGKDSQITVVSVDVDSPAANAGVKVGDVLVSIEGTVINHTAKDLLTAREILNDSTKALVKVSRNKTEQAFNLSSAVYTIKSVDSRMIDNIAYIRITQFNEQTAEQFYAALDKLTAKNVEGFIFDLRDNRGGSLEAASEMTGYLLPTGTFANSIASDGTATPITSTSAYVLRQNAIVLVNENTEGEAELFAGALQECSVARVVGSKTFGRSRIQNYYALSSDNAAIKLSVAELSLTKAGSWEGEGITPDVLEKTPEGYVNVNMLSEKQDTQLQVALQEVNKPGADVTQITTTTKATTKKTTTTTTAESE
ncbi:MAG: PDZ domain-containing protein [Clostridia bacterium]|nr:PDZ domain-containing protein [Clostridia bacterium]